tara:strand:- start:555 stop:947 length:393 start_codon:yes stop_codon:yes gene_type:complete
MTKETLQRDIMPPVAGPETDTFWKATANEKLILKFCRACESYHYYPRSICPHCFSDETEWREAKGDGKIHTLSVMRRAPVPYIIAYVELAEGPMMMCNIIDCDLDDAQIGQFVHLRFMNFEGGKLPAFAL